MKRLFGILILIVTYTTLMTPFQSCEKDCDDECDTCNVLYKPNIYLYPKEKIQLSVKLNFPKGGKVIKSIPEYGKGWQVSVDSMGMIDNHYTFLFYESKQPNVWQKNNGWIIKQKELESFFRNNMSNYGFQGQEIQDFIDYWIPKFTDFEYYIIYPQLSDIIDTVIELKLSKSPDHIMRLFYVIKGSKEFPENKLKKPTVEQRFKRDKFFVTEWGVILE